MKEEEAAKYQGHEFDDDGLHDEDDCRVCLESRAVINSCRCSDCCLHLLIEVNRKRAAHVYGEFKLHEIEVRFMDDFARKRASCLLPTTWPSGGARSRMNWTPKSAGCRLSCGAEFSA
jgi:hypothetical protein